MRILVIEDHLHTAQVVERCFSEAGHRTTIVNSTKDALDTVYTRPHDLILIGWTTPGIAGTEFVRHLRAHAEYEHIPIVMFTLKDDTSEVAEAVDAGVDIYLLKRPLGWQPIDCKIMLDRIERLHRRKSARR